MTAKKSPRGILYRCPICGAELAVLSIKMGGFAPRCCNVPMVALRRHVAFYTCPVCGAEVAILHPGEGTFAPRCCNRPMAREAA